MNTTHRGSSVSRDAGRVSTGHPPLGSHPPSRDPAPVKGDVVRDQPVHGVASATPQVGHPHLTRLSTHPPWNTFVRAGTRLLCPDGVVRAPSFLASVPDTFFSVPAGITLFGVYMRGYATSNDAGDYTFRPLNEDAQSKSFDGASGCVLGAVRVAMWPERYALTSDEMNDIAKQNKECAP